MNYTAVSTSLMNVIPPAAKQLIENEIIQSMSVIDWGKAMARCNEVIQKYILKSIGIDAYDPETDVDCPKISTANNSPGFDILAKLNGKCRTPKLRQAAETSANKHIETTRRHSKNKGKHQILVM